MTLTQEQQDFFAQKLAEIESKIESHIQENQPLREKAQRLRAVKGVGPVLASPCWDSSLNSGKSTTKPSAPSSASLPSPTTAAPLTKGGTSNAAANKSKKSSTWEPSPPSASTPSSKNFTTDSATTANPPSSPSSRSCGKCSASSTKSSPTQTLSLPHETPLLAPFRGLRAASRGGYFHSYLQFCRIGFLVSFVESPRQIHCQANLRKISDVIIVGSYWQRFATCFQACL